MAPFEREAVTTDLTVGKQFALTTGCVLIMSTIISFCGIYNLSQVNTNVSSLASDAFPGLFASAKIRANLLKLRGDYLTHISATDPTELATAEEILVADSNTLRVALKEYDVTINHEDDRQNFKKLKESLAAMQAGWEVAQPLSRATRNAEAFAVYHKEILPPMAEARTQADVLVKWNTDAGNLIMNATIDSVQRARWTTAIMSLTAILVGVWVSWTMIRSLKRKLTITVQELSDGAQQIVSAASQVASSSQSLAQGASQQAASLETSASAEEISSMAKRNTENALQSTSLIDLAESKFVNAHAHLEKMVDSMDKINDSSKQISKIIKVIDEIAFQTNILALNAAVEAARAGVAGKGFAVVADEVRSLAQRCTQAAKDTEALIEDSVLKSLEGKTNVDEVKISIQEITAEFTKVKLLVIQVSEGSGEQSKGIGLIGNSLSYLDRITQTNAASAEQNAAAAEQLNAQAETMTSQMGYIISLVG